MQGAEQRQEQERDQKDNSHRSRRIGGIDSPISNERKRAQM